MNPVKCEQCGAFVPAPVAPPFACGYCGGPLPAPELAAGRIWLSDEHVLAHLRQRLTGADSTWLHPSIPPKKLTNVQQVHAAHVPASEQILGIYDGTAFGSAKDGFAVTSARVCWKNTLEGPQFLEWAHVDPDEVYVDGKNVVVGRAKLETLYGKDDEGLYAWADAIETLARSARPGASVDAGSEQAAREPDPGWGGAAVAVAAASGASGGGGGGWGGMAAGPAAPAPTPTGSHGVPPGPERLSGPPYQVDVGCSLVDVHPSAELVLAAGGSTVDVRYVASGQRYVAFATPDGVLAARFSPDGNWVLAGGMDHRVNLYELRTGQHRGATPPMEDYCDEIAWLGPSRFAMASQSGELWVVDAGTMQVQSKLLRPDADYAQLGGIAVAPGGTRLFASVGERIGAFDLASGQIVWRLDSALPNASRLTVSPGGDLLVAAGYDGVAFFDAHTGQPGRRYPFRSASAVTWPEQADGLLGKIGLGQPEEMSWSWSPRPRFSPAGHTVAVQDHVGNLNFVEVSSQQLYPTPRARGRAWIEDVAWFPDGNHVVVGMSDNTVGIWSARPMQAGQHFLAVGELPPDAYANIPHYD